MPSKYFADVLIARGKLLSFHSRLLHSLASVTSCTVLGIRANLHSTARKKNLSVIGSPGPSFQVCKYHSDCLLSRPGFVSGNISQKALMAACGSRSAFSDNLTGAAYRSFGSCSNGIGFVSFRKASMSLRNNNRRNNNLSAYGYFVYSNFVKRKGSVNPFMGFRFSDFLISASAHSSAGTTPDDVSLDNATKGGQHSSSGDSSEPNTPITRSMKLISGSCYLPHPDKEETGGEDAHFICTNEQAIGVADGVGGWADLGVDAGKYARELMSNSVSAVLEEPKGSIDPARVLEKAHIRTNAKGSSTACIIALTDKGLHATNLGDSGFMVVRDGCTIFRSVSQQHDFNFPYQLESGNSGDLPSSGQVLTVPVASGDVIITGTDGLFDNLYNSDITAVVVHAKRAGFGPQVTAQKIAALARQRAMDSNRQTPFSTAAQEAGFRYYGGKLDDITVVVSYITSDHNNERVVVKSSI